MMTQRLQEVDDPKPVRKRKSDAGEAGPSTSADASGEEELSGESGGESSEGSEEEIRTTRTPKKRASNDWTKIYPSAKLLQNELVQLRAVSSF